MKPRVLIVDDDTGVRYTLREILESAEMDVIEARDGVEALGWLQTHRADLVITDLQMPRLDGLQLLERLQAAPPAPKTILLTAHGSERHAVRAMKLGAFDYFSKPFDTEEVLGVVERAVASVRAEQENEQLRAELLLSRHVVFASEAMKRIALLVYRVAPKDVTVLITGPSGTGKERIAGAIVAGSPRASSPFIRFNCAAIPRDLAEAELFGHAKGAFTGASRARPGLFREAHGGTILLDEISEMDMSTQGKLLRVLQERTVRPVGEDRDDSVDVRVLATTNKDLKAEVAAGRFREDLYYRLDVVEVRLPPLEERMDDVPVLITHFLDMYQNRFATGPLTLTAALREHLQAGPFPGNVRELEHRVERAVALSTGGVADATWLMHPRSEEADKASFGLKERVDAYERGILVHELAQCRGNRSEAARRLGIARVTLLEKLKKYGITRDSE
ncbi:MAG TPA: sigma-54 dependent transcriptional regulator [Polyangiaceae bacterium]|nr:MAG: Transcriptional regulatory protein ZraR [Deltaproteobacteria bacterium ADurb.Bin207]HNS98238.1 sigma-54 dependent transcriptional regulator [Polyangiaceae bacterium]HNZ25378.1 sigma-54 dependent transcriptional regulator [Polyangiaceae bacterium]HOD24897.1 sigma-54 dependent transcriptional regulator [Polyangiaceae bacterium]HOE51107.1 sigma-54 dependent transcriptional regulator [Polyangiaceae bacterium]